MYACSHDICDLTTALQRESEVCKAMQLITQKTNMADKKLSKQKGKDVQNLAYSQHMWGENGNIFHTFQSTPLKFGRVN